jgi:hypothetical protein
MSVPTPEDYRRAARFNLWASERMRAQRRTVEAAAHLSLADFYIKQELRRHLLTMEKRQL